MFVRHAIMANIQCSLANQTLEIHDTTPQLLNNTQYTKIPVK